MMNRIRFPASPRSASRRRPSFRTLIEVTTCTQQHSHNNNITTRFFGNHADNYNNHHYLYRNYRTLSSYITHDIPLKKENHLIGSSSSSLEGNSNNSDSSFSSSSSSSSSSSTSSSASTTRTTTTTTTTGPPRPPPHPPTLPTLDASPILDPTLYIKKYSKSNHTKCGSEASKRLVQAQNKIRKWIWDFDDGGGASSRSLDNNVSSGIGSSTADADANDNHDSSKSLNFVLIGHGVPFQLLQDHVDVAWMILNQLSPIVIGTTSGYGSGDEMKGGGSEAVECSFYRQSGELILDW